MHESRAEEIQAFFRHRLYQTDPAAWTRRFCHSFEVSRTRRQAKAATDALVVDGRVDHRKAFSLRGPSKHFGARFEKITSEYQLANEEKLKISCDRKRA
jgi:hypothetical protein